MTATHKGIVVGCSPDAVLVQVAGRGTFQNSQALRRYTQEMVGRGYRTFVIEVSACSNMDSTFLGVLAGLGLRLRKNGEAPGTVTILNAAPRHLELLQTLGLDRLFLIPAPGTAAGNLAGWERVPMTQLPETDLEGPTAPQDKNDTALLMLDAHHNLVRADERNEPRFRHVTRALRERLEHEPRNRSPGTRRP